MTNDDIATNATHDEVERVPAETADDNKTFEEKVLSELRSIVVHLRLLRGGIS